MWTVWIAIAVAVLGLAITAIPLRYDKVRTLDPNIRDPQFRNLVDVGVAPKVAAACDVAADLALFGALFANGALLFLRGSASRDASFLSLALILYGAGMSGLLSVHRTTGPPFLQSPVGLLATLLFFFQTSTSFTVLFWLPEGRFAFRSTAWLTRVLVVITGEIYVVVPFPKSNDLVNVVALPAVVISSWSQIARYRQIAMPAVRERIKWAVIGIVVASLGFVLQQAATLILSSQPGLAARVVMLVAHLVYLTCQIALLGCFAVAIVRYRLWTVDLVINRSLVYGTVSLLLVGIFLAGAFVLQGILGPNHGSVAFAVSTIGAAFLFNPARKHVQHIIDRRLYGFRFDLNELRRAQEPSRSAGAPVSIGGSLGPYRILRVSQLSPSLFTE